MTSCSSKKREYEVIKESDPWYECSSFDISNLYPDDVYEYSDFETVGATADAIYIKAEAQKIFDGNIDDLSEDEIVQYYENSILKLSFDGELLEKTDYITKYNDGCFRYLDKAWISDGNLSILEVEFDKETATKTYIYNGKELDMARIVQNELSKVNYISDIYSSGGYTVYSIFINNWRNYLFIERPDGTCYGLNQQIIDALGGFCNDQIISRNFTGFSRMDKSTGKLEQICEYSNIDASLYDLIESELMYVSSDNNEMIMGTPTYESVGNLDGHCGFKITHLVKADKNPNAGKTVLIVSTTEGYYPDEAEMKAVPVFNRQNDSYFVKFVFPYDISGEYSEVDADIYLSDKINYTSADANQYVDLSPYIDLNSDLYFSNAVNAAKYGDSLYHMPLNISASGIITASTNVPSGQVGFTFESYDKFVDDVCNGIDPMSKTPGYMMGKSEYFTRLFMNMSEKFIYDGKAHIDTEDFRNLMIFVDTHGSADSMSEYDAAIASINEHNAAIQEINNLLEGKTAELDGKLGAEYGNFYSFDDYIGSYRDYGEGLGVYGLPSYDGRGPMTISDEFVSISAKTEYVEPCTEFVKLLLSFDVQCTKYTNPINRDALRYMAEQKLDTYNSSIEIISKTNPAAGRKIPSEAVDKYIELLSSSYGGVNVGTEIENILREESSSYFNGSKSMDDVIPVMQNRIQTVLNENN